MAPALPLLLLLLSGSCLGAHAGDELNYTIVSAGSMKHIAEGATCSGHKEMPSANRTWLPLNRPHGPCASSWEAPPDGSPQTLLDDILFRDQLHTNSIRRKLNGGADMNAPAINDDHDGGPVTAVDHMVQSQAELPAEQNNEQVQDTAAAGTRQSLVTQTVAIDTSSDIPWVQCLPCPAPQCHPQKDRFYDPSMSSTYAAVPCGTPACAQLGSTYGSGCSRSQQCQYVVNYGDGRATAGTYVTDTLTLTPATVIRNFRFGCSHAVRGSFSDQTAGILALGGGPQSLLGQTARTFGNAFSYCIPQPSSKGFLMLGGPNGASSAFMRTPLIRNRQAPTFYIVRLQAITVAGQRLNVPPSIFSAGSVVDSSTIITQLPPTAYRALRSAFRNTMRMYPLTAPSRNLDTCYNFIGFPRVTVPKVSLIFDRGATVELDPTSVMIDSCLAFTSTPSDRAIGFIGNVQQQTYEVLYDVGARSMGFRRGAC